MKKILMIATGGTIACTVSENGLAPALSGNDLLQYVPKLKDICHIDILEIMNIDSSNISPKHYKMMIETIEENYNLYDGFVITHGTDTMAYSSSFLSNAIENLSKPVVFTGSQLPIQVDYTDAKDNIKPNILLDGFFTLTPITPPIVVPNVPKNNPINVGKMLKVV